MHKYRLSRIVIDLGDNLSSEDEEESDSDAISEDSEVQHSLEGSIEVTHTPENIDDRYNSVLGNVLLYGFCNSIQ